MLSKEIASIPIERSFIGFGDSAIKRTVNIMADTIKKSSEDYYIRRWAEKFLDPTPPGDEILKLKSLFFNVSNSVRYVKDISGLEMIKNPKVVLQQIEVGEIPSLDCDCMTTLILSLARSVGFPVAIRVIAMKPNGKFSHVYGLALVKKQGRGIWVPLDLTRPDKGYGWEFSSARRVETTMVI